MEKLIEEENKNFLSNYVEVDNFCFLHTLDPIIKQILSSDYKSSNNKKKHLKFFKEKLVLSLKKNEEVINSYLREIFGDKKDEEFFNIKSEINVISEEEYVNFFGFSSKKYYCLLQKQNFTNEVQEKNKIFIFHSNNEFIEKHIYVGIEIWENGKLFAGRFDENGFLDGRGVYINKAGSIFLGEFKKSELLYGKVCGLDNSIYEGSILKFKKHGVNQKEKNIKYDFVGDFNNGKKIKGIYYFKSDMENYNQDLYLINGKKCDIVSVEIDKENFSNFKENYEFTANYVIKSLDNKHFNVEYKGKLLNSKLNDTNCKLIYDNVKKFPYYEGSIEENKKNGYGKYFWNEEEFYSGYFKDNLFECESDSDIQSSYIKSYGRKFRVTFENGKFVILNEIK